MVECYVCHLRPAIREGHGLCEVCLNAHKGKFKSYIPLGKSFLQFCRESLRSKPKFEALLVSDDVLLQYEYYKFDHTFLPLLGGESASYRDEHKKLEKYYYQIFLDIFKERVHSLDGIQINNSDFNPIKSDFFKFYSSIIQLLLKKQVQIENEFDYIGTSESYPLILLFKKRIAELGKNPSIIDVVSREFDPGSSLFFLELYILFKEKDLIENFQKMLILDSSEARAIIRSPVLLLKPWDHQDEAFNTWKNQGQNGIIEMATATGKTVVGLMAIQDLYRTKPTGTARIFAHSRAILNQWRREVVDKLGILDNKSGDFTRSLHINGFSIHFNTLQTVYKDPDQYPADLLIADEVHHTAAPEFKNALSIPCPSKMGLSATVEGEDRTSILKDYLGPVVYQFSLDQALNCGILPEFKWFICPTYLSVQENEEFVSISEDIRKRFLAIKNNKAKIREISGNKTEVIEDLYEFIKLVEHARYNKTPLPEDWKILQSLILKRRWIIHRSNPRLLDATELARELSKKHKIVLFTMDIESCELVAQQLKSDVKKLYVIHSQIKEEPFKLIEEFRQAKTGVLIGARMLDEGIDIPDADVGINIASSKTRLQLIQRLGRILRKKENKFPVFYHYVALPDPNNYIADLDDMSFLDDLAWVQDTALRMNLTTELYYTDSTLKEVSSSAQKEIYERYYGKNLDSLPKIGTFNPKAIIEQFPKESIQTIISRLQHFGQNKQITDSEWSFIVRETFSKKQKDTIYLPGFWWLLILGDRNPGKIIRLFDPNFNTSSLPPDDAVSLQVEAPFDLETAAVNAYKLFRSGDYDRSLLLCNQFLDRMPNVARIWYLKGATLNKQGKYLEAKDSLLKSISLNDKLPHVWEVLGQTYQALSLDEESADCYKTVVILRENFTK